MMFLQDCFMFCFMPSDQSKDGTYSIFISAIFKQYPILNIAQIAIWAQNVRLAHKCKL